MPDVPLPYLPEKFKLSPEFRLVVACSWIAPPALEQGQADNIASLCSAGIDWDAFVTLVRRHGVAGIAYATLRRHAGSWLPDTVSEAMKAHSIQVSGQALRQTAELVRISRLFAEQSIRMIAMKGVLLSLRLYGNPALRESTDIDLMVPLEDFDRADQLMRADGYRCTSPGSGLTERQKKYYLSISQNYEYCHDTSGLKLELHWRSNLWSQVQTDVLWGRCQSFAWMGESFNIWDDDALLLTLCYHGAHHEWCSLKWLSDVAMLLSHDRPDGWDSLLTLADQLGMGRVLAQSALLVHWLYGIPLPGLIRALIEKENSSIFLCSTAIHAMLMSSEEIATAGKRLDTFRRSWYLIRLIPNLSYSELMKSNVIKSLDIQRFPLPDKLFWLYIPLRPVFWFWRNFTGHK